MVPSSSRSPPQPVVWDNFAHTCAMCTASPAKRVGQTTFCLLCFAQFDNEYPWISIDVRAWIPVDIHGCPWMSMHVHGHPWVSMDIDGYIYVKIKRGMYGLKQVAILAYDCLVKTYQGTDMHLSQI